MQTGVGAATRLRGAVAVSCMHCEYAVAVDATAGCWLSGQWTACHSHARTHRTCKTSSVWVEAQTSRGFTAATRVGAGVCVCADERHDSTGEQ